MRALCDGAQQQSKGGARAEEVGVSAAGVPKCYCDVTQIAEEGLPKLSRVDLRLDQQQDPLCSLALKALESKQTDLFLKSTKKEACILHKEWDRLQLKQGVVYRRGPSDDGKEKWQLFLPEKH